MSAQKSIPTTCVTSGRTARAGAHTHTANPPIYQASTILFDNMTALREAQKSYGSGREAYTYGRLGTPTSFALTDALCELEGGYSAFLAPSGLAAISTALLSQLSSGQHLLMVDTVYGPVRKFCDEFLVRMGVQTTYYPVRLGLDIQDWIQTNTALVYLESPGSLSFEIQDTAAICAAAKAKGVTTMMDNTWATPLFFKPFEHGVDIIVHALTKYIGGHSDLMMGAVVCNEHSHPSVRNAMHQTGQFSGSGDISLALRGLRTLSVRMKAHEASALKIAQWFSQQSEVAQVLHPALSSHPQHELWQRDFRGSSGLFGVLFHEKYSEEALTQMVESYKMFGIGFSWGGFESLALPTFGHLKPTRDHATHTLPMIRYQIGLEDIDDLLCDLSDGLKSLSMK
ncbi:cystathionine beta-lyase [Formosimonas limnophila]|uniref:Cystathionine beta-lyase n=1 Tax=Formosimonas limnophila TaxID=1384487 RepID=A0A8J3CFN7_9BURK|nr:cystathionine beta-lyase [Formosimonas limnophila]GHA64739.1 cystathionine beta-lyase [Formosimonas limnophila]